MRGPSQTPERKPDVISGRIFCICSCWSACQVIWAVQYAFGTPTFRSLGVPHSVLGLIWIAGPLSGVLVQPVVGTMSDALPGSSCGRRKPFLIFGGIIASSSLLTFSSAEWICNVFGLDRPVGAVIAVSAFVMMDCALNAYQGPVRALISDLFRLAGARLLAGSLLASTTGASWLLGYGVGSLNLVRIFPVFSSEFQAVSAMAATYMALFGLLPLGFLVEPAQLDGHPAGGQRPPRTRSWVSVMARSLPEATAAFTALPSSIMPAFRVQFGTFWAWFAFKMFATEWMGTAVFLGHPRKDRQRPARPRGSASRQACAGRTSA
ncbi:unnamed protein product [Prorocentrum cordatum]|uniref:Solute carrier family 40 protein n=1 Tax=Prorocentrum cordatum TaxID=2364126 RepID=A0ABN9URX3_9DINO|nr:unnamed protein product [Polarella glacialis]